MPPPGDAQTTSPVNSNWEVAAVLAWNRALAATELPAVNAWFSATFGFPTMTFLSPPPS